MNTKILNKQLVLKFIFFQNFRTQEYKPRKAFSVVSKSKPYDQISFPKLTKGLEFLDLKLSNSPSVNPKRSNELSIPLINKLSYP